MAEGTTNDLLALSLHFIYNLQHLMSWTLLEDWSQITNIFWLCQQLQRYLLEHLVQDVPRYLQRFKIISKHCKEKRHMTHMDKWIQIQTTLSYRHSGGVCFLLLNCRICIRKQQDTQSSFVVHSCSALCSAPRHLETLSEMAPVDHHSRPELPSDCWSCRALKTWQNSLVQTVLWCLFDVQNLSCAFVCKSETATVIHFSALGPWVMVATVSHFLQDT